MEGGAVTRGRGPGARGGGGRWPARGAVSPQVAQVVAGHLRLRGDDLPRSSSGGLLRERSLFDA
jgi:hypothetical protein